MPLANRNGGDAATGRQVLDLLRATGRIPPPQLGAPGDDPLERTARTYERFLLDERGVKPSTVANYLPTVRRLLAERFDRREITLESLSAQDAHQFILPEAQRLSRSRTVVVHIPWVKNGCIFSLWLQSAAHRLAINPKNPAAWPPSNLETARPMNLKNNSTRLDSPAGAAPRGPGPSRPAGVDGGVRTGSRQAGIRVLVARLGTDVVDGNRCMSSSIRSGPHTRGRTCPSGGGVGFGTSSTALV